ncbi:MAG TPA: nucleotide exchange factor GrpE [Candidatus Avimonoglobus intestinipullorum]|uniref:Protein GrpE n=1 Tax=Candidatus Avimonoglobus intestinipullorum TaxID=2840699 RepID=A0A9D1LV12_9FIRM|nr:nucleotide exchange factor GrpE [Candidatus Avimonoglobus intestinipullorum]
MVLSKEKEKKDENEILEEAVEQQEESPAEEQPEEDLQEKIKEWEDKYMRLYAEFDNYQKRSTREKDARYADAVIDTVEAFLPVYDNLERALAVEVEGEEAKKVLTGVELVAKQMKDVLQNLGVTQINALGEEFDPNLHNAVMHVEDENVTENTIVEEFMKGYIYNGERVVRHSMVKVAN